MAEKNESNPLEEIIGNAYRASKKIGADFFTPEQVLLSSLEYYEVCLILQNALCDVENLKIDLENYISENLKSDFETEPVASSALDEIFEKSNEQVLFSGRSRAGMDIFDVIVSILNDESLFASYFLKKNGVSRLSLLEAVSSYRRERGFEIDEEDGQFLKKFAFDMVKNAAAEDEIIGRKTEINRAIHILCRESKNNPIFVGESGVGKTALAKGIAFLISRGKVPQRLKDARIFFLDSLALFAGAQFRGEIEERLRGIFLDISKMKNAILYIDEFSALVSRDGESSDSAEVLKAALLQKDVRIMSSITSDEWSRIVEKNAALLRRLQKIDIEELSEAETVKILKKIAPRFSAFHKVSYSVRAIKSAAALTKAYLPNQFLPDKAIGALDEAGAAVSLSNHKIVFEKDIRACVSKMANIPLENVSKDESEILKNLEKTLESEIFSQSEAVKTLCGAVKKSRAFFRDENRPEGSFLFVGPTGCGKTELCKVLANALAIPLLRFDMSECQESYSVSRLIGSAPGYVGYENGGLLTEAVRRNPHSVVLFDEIEKAHKDVYNLLLQVLDYGFLTDSRGRKADFRSCMVVMTSNTGAAELEKRSVGFEKKSGDSADIMGEVAKEFPPEFRNRLDAIVPFSPLSIESAKQIAQKCVKKIAQRLEKRKIVLSVSESALDFLAKEGYSREFGARNISRICEKFISEKIVDEVIFGRLASGGSVLADEKGGKLEFVYGK